MKIMDFQDMVCKNLKIVKEKTDTLKNPYQNP